MAYDMVKFERGQVWVIRFKNSEHVGHEIDKDRPWLVLSCGVYNHSAKMITCVPITTREEVVTPSQVRFVNHRGKTNVILCEQIRSFDYSSGSYILDYLGSVSSEILEKVDVAISVHLGLHYSPITLKKLHESMEAMVRSVGYMQQKADTPKFTDDDILEFAEKLQMLAAESSSEVSCSVEVSTPEIIEESIEYDVIPVKSTRVKWTPDVCREFLRDTETLPRESVMAKWGIARDKRYYYMKYYAKNFLKSL